MQVLLLLWWLGNGEEDNCNFQFQQRNRQASIQHGISHSELFACDNDIARRYATDKGVEKVEKKSNIVGIVDKTKYEKVNRVYRGGGSPTITARDFKDPIKVLRRWTTEKEC